MGLTLNVKAPPPGVIQVGLCLDGSGSISSTEWNIIRNGVADAVRDSLPHDGSIELCVIQFSTGVTGNARVEVAPTVITAANAATIEATIRAMSQIANRTPLADGLLKTWTTMKGSANFATAVKQIINVATDGAANEPLASTPPAGWGTPPGSSSGDATWVRNNAVGEGLEEVDAEGIGTSTSTNNWMRDFLVWPQPGNLYTSPPATYVPGWIEVVADAAAFATAMSSKFALVALSPVAIFTEDKHVVNIGETINFDASASYDPDGTIVLYEWDWNGDGTYDLANNPTPSHAYGAAGTYTVVLRVTDNDGRSGTARAVKTVNGAPGVPDFGFTAAIVSSLAAALCLALKKRIIK